VGKFREAIEKLVARPSQPPGGAGTANRLVAPPSGPGTAATAVLGTPPASSQPGTSGSGSAVAAISDSAAPLASGASGLIPIPIRIQHFRLNTDPDPGFL
jgi:hypothetical protein